jgi:hypothetical protein
VIKALTGVSCRLRAHRSGILDRPPIKIAFDGSWPVPVPHARPITLTAAERRRLTALAYSHIAGYQQVIRARIVCDAARGPVIPAAGVSGRVHHREPQGHLER